MVRKDKTLNLEILNSAKKEFLTYGYQEASLYVEFVKMLV